ncbi:MAG: NAD(P)H-binding protein [Bacteroidota bacterium]|nr:NAD(P)H-binding protein [Bacteroidota bacterium]
MQRFGKTAIILGATGLTGGVLLDLLLKDERYEQIKLFTRSRTGLKNPKIEEYLIDLFEMEQFKNLFQADEVYCCVGTTQKKTPDKDTYRQIDFGIPATAAKMAAENGIEAFLVISAMGANQNSRIFYNRTKGEMEGAVLDAKISKTHILRPALISGDREESRPAEFFGKKLMQALNPLLRGKLKKYRSIHPKEIAKSMIFLANHHFDKKILESDEIKDIAAKENV